MKKAKDGYILREIGRSTHIKYMHHFKEPLLENKDLGRVCGV
jgi:hypothetical protein